MGTDTALAVLSNRPRLLYDYFKQLFAQVTNPPLDAIREELVTSMESTIGPEGNLLDPRPESCRQIKIKYPVISNEETAKLRHLEHEGFRTITLPMLFDPAEDGPGLERAMADLCTRASDAVKAGYTILILSDRGVSPTHAPDPEPARHGRRAPPPGARGHAHALRARRRVGRRARGAPLRAAPRLRRRRRQPVSRVRVARRPDPAGPARRRRSRDGGAQLHQGAQQGHPQGDVQDGHLDAPELLRRADLRGARPVAPVRRQVLHVDPVAHRRRGHRGGGRGGGAPPREGLSAPDVGRGRSRLGRRVPVAPRRRVPPVQPADRLQAAARDALRAVRDLQGVHPAGRRPGLAAGDAARADPLQGLAPAGADRRGRAGRDDPEAVLDRRDVVRLDQPGGARDAGDRDEPDRREVEHRRGRRGSRALHARRRTATRAGAPSSRSPRAGSA